ncbi:MAG: cytidine deaminase [Thermoplasmata archaeon]|nr:cytidine deaminase [Thermoplasmata archaeon]NIS14431.1 cytidine deaminase [Thermoplasmata archaeon]NIS22279.1 cytidine deaminase [Thermoplasmata archaeon]NIT80157.1 cytidine deaminase [Thermoplasmata archaeon]NIU51286.1 cytidine deaminase [Thermoplasmata archaeon]
MVSEERLSEMVDAAKEASRHAYCPLSDFPVGAAVLLADGSVFSGCNVENAAYGPTICAERTAVVKAVSERGPDIRIEAVVVYTPTRGPTPPCGPCRQVVSEFGPEALVVSVCDGEEELRTDMRELLPYQFSSRNLE